MSSKEAFEFLEYSSSSSAGMGDWSTQFYRAIRTDDVEMLQVAQSVSRLLDISQLDFFFLLQTRLDVEMKSKNIGRPLCTAAQYDSLRCMCLLLERGFNLEVQSTSHTTGQVGKLFFCSALFSLG